MQHLPKAARIDPKMLLTGITLIYFIFRFIPVAESVLGVSLLPSHFTFVLVCFIIPASVFVLRPTPLWLRFPSAKGWLLGALGGLLALALYLMVDALNPERGVHISAVRIFAFLTLIPVKSVIAVGEEVFFRGVLQEGLRARGATPLQIVSASAILFFAGHAYHPPIYWAAILPYGLILGLVAFKTRSIWPSTLAHAMGNASVSFWLIR